MEEEEEPIMGWKRLKESCYIPFGPPMSNNPLRELANLKQTGFVDDYQRQFQSLPTRTRDLKLKQQVDLFSVRMINELRIDIELQQQ